MNADRGDDLCFLRSHDRRGSQGSGAASAKVLGAIALPRLVRKAAFGADQGKFIRLSELPPEVIAHEAPSPALLDEVTRIGQQLGQAAGRSLLDALQGEDAFAIKTRVQCALSDPSLAHSHYYRSPDRRAPRRLAGRACGKARARGRSRPVGRGRRRGSTGRAGAGLLESLRLGEASNSHGEQDV